MARKSQAETVDETTPSTGKGSRGPQLRWNADRDRAFIQALQSGMNTYPAVVAYLQEHEAFAEVRDLVDEGRLKIRALNLRRKGVNVPRFRPSGDGARGGYDIPVDELNAMLPAPAPAETEGDGTADSDG